MHAFAHDARLAFLRLRKTPGFTLTIVLTLALGIGATTAILSLVEGVLLRPLPLSHPERLVVLGDHLGKNPGISVTAGEIGTYATASNAFASLGGVYRASYELSGGATPEEVMGARFTAGVFPTLGVCPLLGRVFTQAEEDGHQPLAVISYALWLNRYDRNPNILGTSIHLDRKAYTIIGVMPRNFEYPLESGHLNHVQLWVPMSATAEELSPESGFWGYQIVARLKDGVSVPQAAQDADRVAKQIMRDFPASKAALHIRGDVMPLREFAVSSVQPLLRTLFLAVSVVLLIACVNVAGLLLVQAIRRRREYAVRLALGAGSGVILRESVSEGLLLSVAGGAIGIILAAIVIRTASHLLPESMPRIASISMDTTVAGFAIVLALVTGGLCSLAPAFVALKTNLTECLKECDRTGTGAASHTWLRSALVVSEISIALVLLTASGAFLRSFQRMRAVDPGFRPDHVLVGGFQLPLKQYSTRALSDAFNRDIFERLLNKPGIVAVGITDTLPESGGGESAYTIENEPIDRWKLKFAGFATTYGDYFRAMGIPLIEGRYFNPDDRSNAPLVMIVNQSMARQAWPGQSPLGKRMHAGNPKKGLPWATVVGVVADTELGARDEPSIEQWYASMQQPAILYGTEPSGNLGGGGGGYITLRSALPPEQMIHVLRSTVAEIDPLLPLQRVQTMDDVISKVEAPRRFNTTLITSFAIGALLLALTGIYAVVAFSVSLRTQEIAIRMALGAQRATIARLVLISGVKMALLGCGFGVLGSLAVSRLVSSLLFHVSATNPLIYIGSVLAILLMALLASALPATRAASAHPIDTLRSS
jgi:putative ABC transport system permease protein